MEFFHVKNKIYNRNKKTKGIKGHQWHICESGNCQQVGNVPLFAINECTLLKVDENGEIVIADTCAKVEVEEYAVNAEAQEVALQAEIENAKKAATSQAIVEYVPPIEKVEVSGIESAFEVALKKYTVANDEVKESNALMEKIIDKIVIAQEDIEKVEKEIRKTEGSYKRSVKRETLKKLYNRMVELRGVLEDCEGKENFLQQMYKVEIKNFETAQKEKDIRGKVLIEAEKQEGFKYCVAIQDFNGEKNFEHVRTVADAVSFIYINAEGLSRWQIRKLGLCTIAKGTELDGAAFSDLVNGFDEKYIEAEISPVSEKVEYTPATLEEEFNYIEVKAIHNFTFDKYTESIEELKKFVTKASGELKKMALSELKEWLEIARAEGLDYKEESADNEKDSEKAEEMKANKPIEIEAHATKNDSAKS